MIDEPSDHDKAEPDPFAAIADQIARAAAAAAPAAGPTKAPRGRKGTTPRAPRVSKSAVAADDEIAPPVADSGAAGLPWGFSVDPEHGLFFRGSDEASPLWCSAPLSLVSFCRDPDGGGWCKHFTFLDPDGAECAVTISFESLAGEGAAIRALFADRGLLIAGRRAARDKFVECLAEWKSPNFAWTQSTVGWSSAGTFAIPRRTFSADGESSVIFRGSAAQAPFAAAGTLAEWSDSIARLTTGHDLPMFFVALALTGPCLFPLGLSGFGFNVWGPSSSGKTIALRLAASVWGGRAFMKTFLGTSNSFESIAAMHCDTFLPLDEMAQASSDTVKALAFMLSQGSGKSRARPDSELKGQKVWRVVYGCTNEGTTAGKIEEDGGPVAKAGQLSRLIDLAVSPVSGVFADGLSRVEYKALADAIDAATKTTYGTAGPAFLEHLVADREGSAIDLRRLMLDFTSVYVDKASDGQVHRVAEYFAAVSAAGEYAVLLKVLPYPPGSIRMAAGRLFRAWLASRGGSGPSEERQAIVCVRNFIQEHAAARFHDLTSTGSWRIQYAAGYRDADDFYINDVGWKQALRGLDPRNAADALARRGFLIKNQTEGRRKFKKHIPSRNVSEWLYRVPSKILEYADEIYESR